MISPRIARKTHDTLWGPSALDLYTLLCGVFLAASPWLFKFLRPAGRLDAELGGVALIALSAAGVVAFATWGAWLKLALGLWLIAAPWALGFLHNSAMHVSLAVGLIVAFLTLLELWLSHDPDFSDVARANGRAGLKARQGG